MAKGNLFQGMGRGKVGDVVFSRLNGQQISRVRNRNPKNPRTNAQLYQRAIMATVMQAYAAGKEIFDHSFQGKEVGAGNQRRFMSLNTKLLRGQIAADIEGDVAAASQLGRVVAPGVPSPVPGKLQVSEGTLSNILRGGYAPQPSASSITVAEFCAECGIVANDLFTIVALKKESNAPLFVLEGDDTNYSKQYPTVFQYARYKIKASALSSTTLVSAAKWGDILELDEANFSPKSLDDVALGVDIMFTTLTNQMVKDSFAWIHSRLNEDLRSTEVMDFEGADCGVVSSFALAAWRQGSANLGESSLILEGGDL